MAQFFDDVVATYERDGPFAAVGKFVTWSASTSRSAAGPAGEAYAGAPGMMDQLRRNVELFFPHQFTRFAHVLDTEAVKATAIPVVWAGGAGSHGTCVVPPITRVVRLGTRSPFRYVGRRWPQLVMPPSGEFRP